MNATKFYGENFFMFRFVNKIEHLPYQGVSQKKKILHLTDIWKFSLNVLLKFHVSFWVWRDAPSAGA